VSYRTLHDNLGVLAGATPPGAQRSQAIDWRSDGNRASGSYGWSEARALAVRYWVSRRTSGRGDELQLSALFNRLNLHHFGGTLPAVPVKRGLPYRPGIDDSYLALCHTKAVAGNNPAVEITIFMAERLFSDPFPDEANRWKEISRCLLHEMVHVAVDLDEIGGRFPDGIDDHGQEFADECNRIGRAAGWDHVVGAEKASSDGEDASWWPLGGGCETCAVSAYEAPRSPQALLPLGGQAASPNDSVEPTPPASGRSSTALGCPKRTIHISESSTRSRR